MTVNPYCVWNILQFGAILSATIGSSHSVGVSVSQYISEKLFISHIKGMCFPNAAYRPIRCLQIEIPSHINKDYMEEIVVPGISRMLCSEHSTTVYDAKKQCLKIGVREWIK